MAIRFTKVRARITNRIHLDISIRLGKVKKTNTLCNKINKEVRK